MEPVYLIAIAVILCWIPCTLYLVSRSSTLALGIGGLALGAILGPEFFSQKLGPLPITIDRLFWAMLVVAVVWKKLESRSETLWNWTPVDFYLISFLVLVFLSTFAHDWQRDENLPLGRLLFFQFIPITYFWLGRSIQIRERDVMWFAVIGIAFGIYLSITGIAEKFGFHSWVFPGYIVDETNFEFFGRARGPFLNPIGNGICMIFSIVCCCLLWQKANQTGRLTILCIIALLSVGVYCTMTRSVWLGLAVSIGMIAWLTFPLAARGGLIATATVASLLVLFVLMPYLNHFKRDQYVTADEMSQSVGLRPMLFAVAWELNREKPILGHGYGQYKKISPPYHRTHNWDMELQTVQPYLQHNIFLAYLAELGWAGLILFTITLLLFFVNSYQLAISNQIPSTYALLCVGILVVNTNMLINGLFHDVSLIVVIGSLFFFLNGLAFSIRDRELTFSQDASTPA